MFGSVAAWCTYTRHLLLLSVSHHHPFGDTYDVLHMPREVVDDMRRFYSRRVCDAGYYAPPGTGGSGPTMCLPCAPGTVSAGNSSVCTSCPPGAASL